jgi:hypothetical protein
MYLMNEIIFLLGCPRSGTTLTLDVMASHPDFAWISNRVNRFPFIPQLSILNRIYDIPCIGQYFYRNKSHFQKLLPQPLEPWKFWNYHLVNFQWRRNIKSPPRCRNEHDISRSEIEKIRWAVNIICNFQNKKHFLSKYTDFPRIRYLSQAFPNAKFVHIIRDGRAVANSYLSKIKNNQFNTWREREWWISGWPESWKKEWKMKYFDNPLSFAAYQWKFFVSVIRMDSKYISSDQYLEVKYEDMITNPKKEFTRILGFCNMSMNHGLIRYLKQMSIENMNFKWKRIFSPQEKEMLDKIIFESEFRLLFRD